MKKYEFKKEALSTLLEIQVFSGKNPEKAFLFLEKEIESFEENYSRFLSGNLLSKINSSKDWTKISKDFFKMLSFSISLAKKTNGAFDPTVIGALENFGYDKDYSFKFSEKNQNFGFKKILFEKNKIKLIDGVRVEFGAVGKGFLVDKISKLLLAYESFLINFGGDFFSKGNFKIGLEHPLDSSKILGVLDLQNSALACSSTQKRKIGDFHHLLDLRTKKPNKEVLATFVQAKTCMEADGYATCLNLLTKKEAVELAKKEKLKTFLIFKDFSFFVSEDFEGEIFV